MIPRPPGNASVGVCPLRGRLGVLWAALAVTVACAPSPPREEKARQNVPLPECLAPVAPSPSTLSPAASPQEVHLYIDASGSMRGFAEQGDSPFGTLLAALRPVLLDLGVERGRVTRMGGTLATQAVVGGFTRFDARAYYDLGETDLAGALEAVLAEASPRTLSVLLTDGVMSLQREAGEEGWLTDCERGSDVQCLSHKVKRLVESGRGFWIVGLRSPFRGALYSELLRPGGASLGEVEVPDRPFYLWVIGDHPGFARTFIEKLLARLDQRHAGERTFALEVAPGHVPWRVPRAEAAPTSDSRLFPAGARSGAVTGRYTPALKGDAGTQVVAGSELEGTAFGLRLALAPTPLSTMPSRLEVLWEYRPLHCLRWQEESRRTIVQALAEEEEGGIRLAILTPTFQRLRGRRATVVERFVKEGRASEALPDLKAWSTTDDRTPEQGSRTLNLDEFLFALNGRLSLVEAYEQPLLNLEFQ